MLKETVDNPHSNVMIDVVEPIKFCEMPPLPVTIGRERQLVRLHQLGRHNLISPSPGNIFHGSAEPILSFQSTSLLTI